MISEIRADKSNLHAFDSVTTFVYINKMETIFCLRFLLCLATTKQLDLYCIFFFNSGINKKTKTSNDDKLRLKQHFTNVAPAIVDTACV